MVWSVPYLLKPSHCSVTPSVWHNESTHGIVCWQIAAENLSTNYPHGASVYITVEINEKELLFEQKPKTYLLGLRCSFFLQRLAAMNSRTTTRAKKTPKRTFIRVLFIIEVPTSRRKSDRESRCNSLEAIWCCLLISVCSKHAYLKLKDSALVRINSSKQITGHYLMLISLLHHLSHQNHPLLSIVLRKEDRRACSRQWPETHK